MIAYAVAFNGRDTGPGEQLAAMHAYLVQYSPAAHNRQFAAKMGTAFEHGHLAPTGNQELRQFQANQTAADDGYALAQGHPDP